MERYSDRAIEIINKLHTERLDYASEYIPLINCAMQCKDYEDAEEQGLLVRLPCKVGDTVYEATKGLSIYSSGLTPYIHETVVISVLKIAKWVINGDFGKTVFLTRGEAEAALSDRNDGGKEQ